MTFKCKQFRPRVAAGESGAAVETVRFCKMEGMWLSITRAINSSLLSFHGRKVAGDSSLLGSVLIHVCVYVMDTVASTENSPLWCTHKASLCQRAWKWVHLFYISPLHIARMWDCRTTSSAVLPEIKPAGSWLATSNQHSGSHRRTEGFQTLGSRSQCNLDNSR